MVINNMKWSGFYYFQKGGHCPDQEGHGGVKITFDVHSQNLLCSFLGDLIVKVTLTF